jgi:hypothetical protein
MPVRFPQLDRLRQGFDRLRARIEQFIAGPPPDDPLYLTNRSLKQRLKLAALIGLPVVLLAALVMIGVLDLFRIHAVDPFERPPTEAAPPVAPQKRLPEPKLTVADLEVVNIRIAKDAHPPMVTGVVRNNTNEKVDSAEVSYYLADNQGSLVGTDTTDVQNLAPHSSVTFRMTLKVARAEYVIVRDVHPE